MHVAICDDNVADRKQLERLLKRESDKRAQTKGPLYVDSFGSAENLLKNPMQYDAFFIDMCKGNTSGIDLLNSLTTVGSTAPVILCSSDINYHELTKEERVIFLDKPILAAMLPDVIDHAQQLADMAEPVIELRSKEETFYVKERDILFACESGCNITVTLVSGQQVIVGTNILNFFSQIEQFSSFFAPNTKVILNGRHISKISFHKITMIDGSVFKAFGKILEYARLMFREFEQS